MDCRSAKAPWPDLEIFDGTQFTRMDAISTKKCFQCEKEKAADNESPLLKCSRCLAAFYCSRHCQKLHWLGEHKKVCGKSTQKGKIPFSVPNGGPMAAEPNKFELIDYTIADPPVEDVSGCCAFCAMITLVDGNNKMYFIPEVMRVELLTLYSNGFEPYPANCLRMIRDLMDYPPYPPPKDNYTRHKYSAGPNGIPPERTEVGCCLYCARKIRDCPTFDDPVFLQHFFACQDMLTLVTDKVTDAESFQKFEEISKAELSWMERRLIAAISLYSRPDLSKGKTSIAGEYSKSMKDNSDSKKQKTGTVTFNFVNLESLAFPDLFVCGVGAWKEDGGIDLKHYTLARLNSISSKWRKNPDYVMFSFHRLVAYGLMPQSELDSLYVRRGKGFLVNFSGVLSLISL